MVSAATRAQLQRTTDADGLLVLLKLWHPDIATAYVVNDTRDWLISGTTWVGLQFRFTLPQSVASEVPRARLEIDNVSRELVTELEKLGPAGTLMAQLQMVSRARPTEVDWQFTSPLSGVSVTNTTVTATVGNDDAMRAPAVKVRFDPSNSPGLFPG